MFMTPVGTHLIGRLVAYSRIRFPALVALAYALLFAISVKKFVAGNWGLGDILTVPVLCITGAIFLFLLRLRLLDEVKDYHYDRQHHSDRPVARGLLSLTEVRRSATIVIVLEAILQLYVPPLARVIWVAALLYSVLMYRDFFIRSRHSISFTLQLVLHHVIFLLYTAYAVAVMSSTWLNFDMRGVALIVFMVAPTLCFEIGRKLEHRYDGTGNRTDDTYAYHWGQGPTFLVVLAVLYLQVAGFYVLTAGSIGSVLPLALLTLAATATFVVNFEYGVRLAKYWTVVWPLIGLLSFVATG